MTTSRKIIKVFLASPGDLQDERRAAKRVVDAFNKQWADYLGVHIELVGWEDTVSRFGRPQESINRELDQCELFIGLMWKKWGSPPSDIYTSGFEEEFERSVKSRAIDRRPEISLLFKAIDSELLEDPGEDLKKVLAFKNKIISERSVLFQSFSNPLEFDDCVRGCITSYAQNLQREEIEKRSDESQTVSSSPTAAGKAQSSQTSTPFANEDINFLSAFVESKTRGLAVSPVEVARFRLLGTTLYAHGNDESTLGVHDANILYSQKSSLVLSLQEKFGLVNSALDNFSNHNVPLWHWIEDVSGTVGCDLTFASVFNPTSLRVGALAAMRLIAEPINPIKQPSTEKIAFDRLAIAQLWFDEQSEGNIRVAALQYLAVCGTPAELPLIKTELDRGNYNTIGPATDAIIQINLRQSREDALKAIYELQPEAVDEAIIKEVFSHPKSLDSSLLLLGTAHRSPQVRRAVLPILVSRSALPQKVAEQLLGDRDATVRYYALRSVFASGKELSEDRVKAILIKPAAHAGFGLLTSAVVVNEGEKEWERVSRERLRASNLATLERLATTEGALERGAHFALDYKQFSKRGDALRQMVDDRFRAEFAREIGELERRIGVDSETVSKIKTIDEYLRKRFLRQGLDILCEKDSTQDLPRIRKALQEGFAEYSELDVDYLKRHGEWCDIDLLISLAKRPVAGRSILSAYFNSDTMDAIAAAIYSIGKGRFRELLAQPMPDSLLSRILILASKRNFAGLMDEEILKYLADASEQIRKLAAMQSIRSLSRKRLKQIFDGYMSRDQRYYNVIHWLDMGTALSRSRAIAAAERVLARRD